MNRTWEPPDHRELDGQIVRLVPLDPARHAGALYAASHGSPEREALWRYLPYGPFESVDAMRVWLETQMNGKADPLVWAVTVRETGAPVGMVALAAIVPEHGRAEIAHVWCSIDVQRSKVNTETQFLLLTHLFDTEQYRRAEWKCNAENAASRRAAARMGFQFEGRFRQHLWLKGRNRDTDYFGMTDKEWPRVRANFHRWLYEDDTVPLDVLNSG